MIWKVLPHPCSSLLLTSVLTFFRVCDAWGGCWVLCSFPLWVVEQGFSPLQAMNRVGTELPAHGCDQNSMFALLPEPLVTLIVLSLFNFVALFYFGIWCQKGLVLQLGALFPRTEQDVMLVLEELPI